MDIYDNIDANDINSDVITLHNNEKITFSGFIGRKKNYT